MQQAHDSILMLKGAGFHDRTGQDFDQAASDRINHDADHDADERIGEEIREESQAGETEAGSDLGGDHTAPVSDGVHEARTEHIDQQLGQEERRGDQRDLPQGDRIVRMELQEQQGSEVGADRLGNERQVAGRQRFPVILFHDLLRTGMNRPFSE